jgi:hypothetical protein
LIFCHSSEPGSECPEVILQPTGRGKTGGRTVGAAKADASIAECAEQGGGFAHIEGLHQQQAPNDVMPDLCMWLASR